MPLVQMIFNLPDEDTEHWNAVNGSKLASVIWNFDQALRSIVKHNSDGLSDAQIRCFERAREMLRDELQDQDVIGVLD